MWSFRGDSKDPGQNLDIHMRGMYIIFNGANRAVMPGARQVPVKQV